MIKADKILGEIAPYSLSERVNWYLVALIGLFRKTKALRSKIVLCWKSEIDVSNIYEPEEVVT